MSLSSFLLGAEKSKNKGKDKAIDTGLDDLFRSTVRPGYLPHSAYSNFLLVQAVASKAQTRALSSSKPSTSTDRKRKEAPVEAFSAAKSTKRSKRETDPQSRAKSEHSLSEWFRFLTFTFNVVVTAKAPLSKHVSEDTESINVASGSESEEDEEQDSAEGEEEESEEEEVAAIVDDLEEDGENEDGEGDVGAANAEDEAAKVSDSDDEGDPSQMVHEAVTKGGKAGSSKKKYVPSEETPEQRNARTIFIGNVPVDVVKSRVRSIALLFKNYSLILTMTITAAAKTAEETYSLLRSNREDRVGSVSLCCIQQADHATPLR